MSGKRLIVGSIVMGVLAPVTIFFFLELRSLTLLAGLMATLFMGWCLTDFTATILSRSRHEGRGLSEAVRDLSSRDDSSLLGR